MSKLPSACPEEHFVTLIFLQKFWTFLDFLQNYLAWFSKIYLSVQSKKCARNSFFLFFFSEFFRVFSKIFSDFWPKNFKNLWKLASACPQEQLVALYFFQKFWTVLDFLQKPLAWFSKFYLSVQSKICGRYIFFYSSFLNFFGFWAKTFSDFWPKNFKNLSKLPSTCPEEQFVTLLFF